MASLAITVAASEDPVDPKSEVEELGKPRCAKQWLAYQERSEKPSGREQSARALKFLFTMALQVEEHRRRCKKLPRLLCSVGYYPRHNINFFFCRTNKHAVCI